MKLFYLNFFFLVFIFSLFLLTNTSYSANYNYENYTTNSINSNTTNNNNNNSSSSSKNNIIDKNDDTTSSIMTKSPSGAIWRSLVLPGWGQIYVENYWKAPIFAASAGTLWYFVIDNTMKYNDYKEKLASALPETSEFNILKNKRNNAVDTRDLSALYLLGVYLIATVDAYVGSHLFDFNVSNNLQLYLSPATMLHSNNNYIKLNIMWRF